MNDYKLIENYLSTWLGVKVTDFKVQDDGSWCADVKGIKCSIHPCGSPNHYSLKVNFLYIDKEVHNNIQAHLNYSPVINHTVGELLNFNTGCSGIKEYLKFIDNENINQVTLKLNFDTSEAIKDIQELRDSMKILDYKYFPNDCVKTPEGNYSRVNKNMDYQLGTSLELEDLIDDCIDYKSSTHEHASDVLRNIQLFELSKRVKAEVKSKVKPSPVMLFDPVEGTYTPYPSCAVQYRKYHGKVAWMYNPYTGHKRDPRDVGVDVFGEMIEQ